MSEVKYGQLSSWEDGDVSTPGQFMRLVEGDNQVRIFTNPYQFVVHWFKDVSGANRKVRCALKNCPLCKRGVKAQYRWLAGVINRRTEAPEILEISSQIYKGIKDYFTDADWGDVRDYDVNIKRGPKGQQPLYTVIAKKPKELTDDEKETIANFLETNDMNKLTQPSTPEAVSEKMGLPSGNGGFNIPKNLTDGVQPKIEDDDFNFGDEEQL